MNPRLAKPGQQVVLTCSSGAKLRAVVVQREVVGCRATTALRVPAFAGQDGPDDVGIVHLSDYDVSRKLRIAGAP